MVSPRAKVCDLIPPSFPKEDVVPILSTPSTISDFAMWAAPPTVVAGRPTQELRAGGSGDTQVKGAGRWRGVGLRAYSAALRVGELKISRLVAPASLSDSEDGTCGPANIAFVESLRKRLRPFPVRAPGPRSQSILTAGA